MPNAATTEIKSVILEPLHENIIVRRDTAAAISQEGIVIPQQAQVKPNTGTVVAVPKLFGPGLKVGDRVMFPDYEGIDMTINTDEVVTILTFKAIQAIIR